MTIIIIKHKNYICNDILINFKIIIEILNFLII